MTAVIYPYKMASKGAKKLAEALGIRRVDARGRMRPANQFQPTGGQVVINWGSGARPLWYRPDQRWLNKPEAIYIAVDKVRTLRVLTRASLPVPQWTTNREEALAWIDGVDPNPGIMIRHQSQGHSGAGCQLWHPNDGDLPSAPLYTLYIPKRYEYRVHVAGGQVFDVQGKCRKPDVPENPMTMIIRNHDNGWFYARSHRHPSLSDNILDQCVCAVAQLGLDFGAVDVILHAGHHRILEINSAPGLEGETINRYAHALANLSA